jgi:hypothetical protein
MLRLVSGRRLVINLYVGTVRGRTAPSWRDPSWENARLPEQASRIFSGHGPLKKETSGTENGTDKRTAGAARTPSAPTTPWRRGKRLMTSRPECSQPVSTSTSSATGSTARTGAGSSTDRATTCYERPSPPIDGALVIQAVGDGAAEAWTECDRPADQEEARYCLTRPTRSSPGTGRRHRAQGARLPGGSPRSTRSGGRSDPPVSYCLRENSTHEHRRTVSRSWGWCLSPEFDSLRGLRGPRGTVPRP